MKKICLTIAFILVILPILYAAMVLAEDGTAADLTQMCSIQATNNGRYGKGRLTDGKIAKAYETIPGKENTIEVTAPSGQEIYGIYIIWSSDSSKVILETENEPPITLNRGFAHEYTNLPGLTHFKIRPDNEKGSLPILEMKVYGKGVPPADVQIWRPLCTNADILILSAHPDDELIFMGGLIPYYAGEKKMRVAVCYATCKTDARLHEMLDGLWTAGCREYPYMLNLPDESRSSNLSSHYGYWGGEDAALDKAAEVISACRPKIIVSHDIEGEYGHGAHKAMADMLLKICRDGKRPVADSVKKLYLHYCPDNLRPGVNPTNTVNWINTVRMDWSIPLSAFNGKTAYQVAQAAFDCHPSQHTTVEIYNGHAGAGSKYRFQVAEHDRYDNSLFGLAWKANGVPKDLNCNDLMENIPTETDSAASGTISPETSPLKETRSEASASVSPAKEGPHTSFVDDEAATDASPGIASDGAITETAVKENTGIMLRAGEDYCMAVAADGSVWAWGDNAEGQFGNGTSKTKPLSPVRAAGGLDGRHIRDIACGSCATLFLMDDGSVYSCGANTYHQLGIEGAGKGKSLLNPEKIPGLNNIIAIACRQSHCLALDQDGHVWAWGNNESGQVGNGSRTAVENPVMLDGPENIISIRCGHGFSLALANDGSIWGWGSNAAGQLANATQKTGENARALTPQRLNVSGRFTALECGKHTSYGIDADGRVWAWGRNDHWQLGSTGVALSAEPMEVPLPDGIKIKEVHSYHLYAVALDTENKLWMWGGNGWGNMGLGHRNTNVRPLPSGTALPEGGQRQQFYTAEDAQQNVLCVSAGKAATYYADTNGKVTATGCGDQGQLGLGGDRHYVMRFTRNGLDLFTGKLSEPDPIQG